MDTALDHRASLPVLARVLPPGCGLPGCNHHYRWPSADCVCVTWPASPGGVHLFAFNPLCRAHHTVMELIEDAAAALEMRGYLDPDEDEIPDHIIRVLLELYLAGECSLCPGWPGPSNLAEHLIARWQVEYEQSLPVWTCTCGAPYKHLTEWGSQEQFYRVADDDMLGDLAGSIRRNSKGEVKHSDACPACGALFGSTIADRTAPQQALFATAEAASRPGVTAKPPRCQRAPTAAAPQDALF